MNGAYRQHAERRWVKAKVRSEECYTYGNKLKVVTGLSKGIHDAPEGRRRWTAWA
jgi:hypothetical protein